MEVAEGGFEDAVGFGVEDDREHGFAEAGLDGEGGVGEGPGGVFELFRGGGLAFSGEEGADDGGLERGGVVSRSG